jgi:hypothetical protein
MKIRCSRTWASLGNGPRYLRRARRYSGLVPAYECYDVCSNAWGQYITGSLRKLITTGTGEPNPVEEHAGHQEEIVAKVREMNRKLQSEQG